MSKYQKSLEVGRRQVLKGFGMAGMSLATWHLPAFSLDETTPKANKKIVWMVLRGAVDSLHAVVPTFEKELMDHRALLVEPIINELLPLDDGFAFHPSFVGMHLLYKEKELSPIIATATNYRARSHFDGQDALECGSIPIQHESGWLNRAILARQSEIHSSGLAIAQSMPISLRGDANSRTWYPDGLKNSHESLLDRLQGLYEYDDILSERLSEAMETNEMLGDVTARNSNPNSLVRACANLLKDEDGPDCAMIEFGGWDTHKNQIGTLKNKFKILDTAITLLKKQLGDTWDDTVVIVATEFGRTVRINGTKGTDHGTASNMFLAGGALSNTGANGGSSLGGKILGDWPGLKNNELYEGRDLRPTTDVRSWISIVLAQHWGMNEQQIKAVFPDMS